MKVQVFKTIILGLLICNNLSLCATSAAAETVPMDSVSLLYRMGSGGIPFYIPADQLVDGNNEPINIAQLLAAYQISCSCPYDDDDSWTSDETLALLSRRAENPPAKAIPISRVPALLADARILLKSFLASDSRIASLNTRNRKELQKKDFYRLFTYAKLRQVINEKQLSHVSLPGKVLALEQWNYISTKEAERLIDTQLVAFAGDFGTGACRVKFLFPPDACTPRIFPEEQVNGPGLNSQALEELRTLFREAPFDVGKPQPNGGNIFSKLNGDAVIIDTEFKGAQINDICKINQYDPTNIEIVDGPDEEDEDDDDSKANSNSDHEALA